ncbi:tetratricopeptide repeat protein [Streptomyces sp. NPDC048290]|uniref:tetratricopeptide repeat protein n=1 Tax=Streptomyces sp. NPDC048290 TaxID=3155811 RepID=UPI003420893F
MSRLSREKQQEPQRAADDPAAALAATPIEVWVSGSATGGASVAGVPVTAAPGQELKRAVLEQLHRAARAAGRPVLATVHDERTGYVIPLWVDPDGTSRLAGEPTPLPTTPPPPAAPASASPFPPPTPLGEHTPTHPLRAAPGTVVPPTGEFGPPPVMDVDGPDAAPGTDLGPDTARTHPENHPDNAPAPAAPPAPPTPPEPPQAPPAASAPPAPPVPPASPPLRPLLPTHDLALEPDPAPTPTPPRGFDAVAEAVLDDRPPAPTPLAGPMTLIGLAVKEGRTNDAAILASRSLTEASRTLGADHTEVRRLAELAAYVAYLAGEPERAFTLSLDLARGYAGAGEAEAAYGNVQSAATAWRAVRDAVRGLELGRELIAVWTELAAEPGGPAAMDAEELDTARARMDRLTARAARAR